MGCGSSSAAPMDSTPVVPQDMHNQKGGKGKQQAQAHPPPIGGATAANSSQGKRASGGGLAGDGDQSAAAAVAAATPPPAPKEKQKMKRLTEDQHAAPSSSSPAAVATAPACDSDATHDATVWCAQCEQRFCSSCDVAAHQPGPARKHQHQRSTLKGSSGGGATKSKFVLKSTAAPAAGSSADASADDDASRMFQVGKFAHAEGTNGGGGGSTHHIDTAPSKDAADMDTSVGLRLKHAKKGAVLNALGEDELSRMNRYELELLWHKYDKDKNLVLNREELKALAADVIARVLKLIEDDLVKHNPGLTPQQIEEQIEEEKAFVLPGKNRSETKREMTSMLIRSLDVNKDGKVTKIEYLAQWNDFAEQMFKLKQEGSLACSIM